MYRRGYEIRDQEACYYLTFQVVGWADVFTRKRYRDIVIDSFKYCQENKGLKIYSWVIMSNDDFKFIREVGIKFSCST